MSYENMTKLSIIVPVTLIETTLREVRQWEFTFVIVQIDILHRICINDALFLYRHSFERKK